MKKKNPKINIGANFCKELKNLESNLQKNLNDDCISIINSDDYFEKELEEKILNNTYLNSKKSIDEEKKNSKKRESFTYNMSKKVSWNCKQNKTYSYTNNKNRAKWIFIIKDKNIKTSSILKVINFRIYNKLKKYLFLITLI